MVYLGQAKVLGVADSAVFQIGDNQGIYTRYRALALQREVPNFIEEEGTFEAYPVFIEPFPDIRFPPGATKTTSQAGAIQVGSVKVLGVSASSVMQIGGSGPVRMESRIKHIRQIRPPGPYSNPTGTVAATAGDTSLPVEASPPAPGAEARKRESTA
ncbi:spore germination protein GerPE [Paenibacillus lutrae]|uniref:spore germination protein GerPE n=1 Tax=Paenibacillus lutrae TaxID=2078573 RepID=UPI001F26F13A|nr:spore germination protein GerPE [Paenibacillus lutrae]